MKIIGWDIGGAHIKAIKIDFKKKNVKKEQIYSPVWKNISYLKKSIKLLKKKLGKSDFHAVTMTAELSDIFFNRYVGTKYIINLTSKLFSKNNVYFYNYKKNFLKKKNAIKETSSINSMNWHASANLLSKYISNCLLIDIGSTTTDIIPIKNGKIVSKGSNDSKRLKNKELLYLGALRTPITALEKHKNIIYEDFSNVADIYRILGKIPKKLDKIPTQDNKKKDKHSSARRLARVYGQDYRKKDFKKWKKISSLLEKKQKKILKENINKIKRIFFKKKVKIVGAGIGKFLIKNLFKKNYIDFEKQIKFFKKEIINLESATSVAFLLHDFLKKKKI